MKNNKHLPNPLTGPNTVLSSTVLQFQRRFLNWCLHSCWCVFFFVQVEYETETITKWMLRLNYAPKSRRIFFVFFLYLSNKLSSFPLRVHVYLFSPYVHAYYIFVRCSIDYYSPFLSIKNPFFLFLLLWFHRFVMNKIKNEQTTQPADSNATQLGSARLVDFIDSFRLYLSIVITCTVVTLVFVFVCVKFMRQEFMRLRVIF